MHRFGESADSGDPHTALIFKLLREKTIATPLWRGANIGSPERMDALGKRLQAFGATTENFVLEQPLPHMFMMFEEGA